MVEGGSSMFVSAKDIDNSFNHRNWAFEKESEDYAKSLSIQPENNNI